MRVSLGHAKTPRLCTPSHARRIFAGVQHADKELHTIKGAGHMLPLENTPEWSKEIVAFLG